MDHYGPVVPLSSWRTKILLNMLSVEKDAVRADAYVGQGAVWEKTPPAKFLWKLWFHHLWKILGRCRLSGTPLIEK